MKENKNGSESNPITEQSIQGLEKARRVETGFLDTVKINRKKQKEVKKFNTSVTKSSCVSLKNPE